MKLKQSLWWVLFATCFLQSCVSMYKTIDPYALVMPTQPMMLQDTMVEIKLIYHVLEGQRNQRYAKTEKRNGVDLMALRIRNKSDHDFHIPGDLLVQTRTGSELTPLLLEEGLSALVDPVSLDHSKSLVEFDGDARRIRRIINLKNDARIVESHIRFVENLRNYYLHDFILRPGKEVSGFLIIPIEIGTPISLAIR